MNLHFQEVNLVKMSLARKWIFLSSSSWQQCMYGFQSKNRLSLLDKMLMRKFGIHVRYISWNGFFYRGWPCQAESELGWTVLHFPLRYIMTRFLDFRLFSPPSERAICFRENVYR